MNLPTNEMANWVEVKIELMVREEDMQWIGFEGFDASNSYTLIDDVSLEKKSIAQCKACGTNATPINIAIGNLNGGFNGGQPLRFIGLENVTDFDLKVYVSPQAQETGNPIRSIFLKNPRCTFQYNHKDGLGNILPVIQYTYVIRASNECDYKKIQFFSTNDIIFASMPPNSYTTGEQSSTKLNPLDNCCKDQLELTGGTNIGSTFLSNECAYLDQYLGASPPLPKLTFKARKTILLNTINSLKNTDLISPTIILNSTISNSSMTILEGTFIARNDCPPPPILLQKANNSNSMEVNYAARSKDDDVILKDDVKDIIDKRIIKNQIRLVGV